MLTPTGRALLVSALRLVAVVAVLAAFGLWWTSEKAPDFRLDLRLRLTPDGEVGTVPAARLGGETRDALALPCGRTLLYTVTVPGPAATLRFHDGHLQGQPELAVSLLRQGGARQLLQVHATREQAWTMHRIDLPAAEGETIALEFGARDGRGRPGLGAVLVADVVLESEGRGADEAEFRIASRAQAADLLARTGPGRRPSPSATSGPAAGLDGPPCVPLPVGASVFVTTDPVPAGARLELVVRVARPYPEGPAQPGRIVLQVSGEPVAALPIEAPDAATGTAEWVAQVDLSPWAGGSIDLGLRREAADNLYVGLRELVVTAPSSVARTPHVPGRGRNVLLVVVDALRPDRLGCAGHAAAATPAIDALAARGVRWDHVRAPSSWTLPDVASLLTGCSPLTHGLGLRPGRVLSPRLTTLAQAASWSGVTTALFSSSPWVGRATGLDQGCETCVESRLPAPVLAEQALDWLEQAAQFDWFLTLVVADPGDPYEPDPRDLERLAAPPAPEFVESLRRLDSRPGAAERPAVEVGTRHDAEIAGVDRAIGMLVDWLADRGLLDDTLIAVVGAEGEEFYEHRGRAHGQSLHDEVVTVPAIVAGPGIAGPDGGALATPEPIELIDVSRLLAAFGKLSVQPSLQGRLPPPFAARLPDPTSHAVLLPFDGVTASDLRASRSGRWLRLQDVAGGKVSLFDLQADPGATRDLLALPPLDRDAVLAADGLARAFDDWRRSCLLLAAPQAVPLPVAAP